jgi:hypothetical protein
VPTPDRRPDGQRWLRFHELSAPGPRWPSDREGRCVEPSVASSARLKASAFPRSLPKPNCQRSHGRQPTGVKLGTRCGKHKRGRPGFRGIGSDLGKESDDEGDSGWIRGGSCEDQGGGGAGRGIPADAADSSPLRGEPPGTPCGVQRRDAVGIDSLQPGSPWPVTCTSKNAIAPRRSAAHRDGCSSDGLARPRHSCYPVRGVPVRTTPREQRGRPR